MESALSEILFFFFKSSIETLNFFEIEYNVSAEIPIACPIQLPYTFGRGYCCHDLERDRDQNEPTSCMATKKRKKEDDTCPSPEE